MKKENQKPNIAVLPTSMSDNNNKRKLGETSADIDTNNKKLSNNPTV